MVKSPRKSTSSVSKSTTTSNILSATGASSNLSASQQKVMLEQMTMLHRAQEISLEAIRRDGFNRRLTKLKSFIKEWKDGDILPECPLSSARLETINRAICEMEKSSKLGVDRWSDEVKAESKGRILTKIFASLKSRGRIMKKALTERTVREKEKMVDEEEERKRLWTLISRKQIPKIAKIMSQNIATRLSNCKKVASLCAKEQQKVMVKLEKSQGRDFASRGKRVLKEMLQFWKRNEREEKELRRRAEKEAAERRRQEEEEREAKRQNKKLQFLITQTELYSHFIARKGAPTQQNSSTSITNNPTSPPQNTLTVGVDFADIDDEALNAQAELAAQKAVSAEREKLRKFDQESDRHRKEAAAAEGNSTGTAAEMVDHLDFKAPSTLTEAPIEIRQPRMLNCQLKGYQIKGLTWLANLYEQGINGILADEMGLGKTVQAISLMAHLAETHNIWGPFLVISPASTLHNWQQEIAKFVPTLRALPYWGNVNDRKTLRKFWNPKKLYSKDSHFHILITSYQLVVADEKYFQKIKWQYMILDEAQAIKSSSSVRWKTLLSFQCRNRLLLTGTPIQNSMQELWALLHFIMPGLFDSHDEFSDWFSKDIESHAVAAESRSGHSTLNEHQLQRLHMILKPFMLRRIKKDVENELGAKVEIDVECNLSGRQKAMYRAIRDKLPMQDLNLLQALSSSSSATDTLMNIVMQFRKVCNHPELFERTEIRSPLHLHKLDVIRPFGKDNSSLLFWDGALANPICLRLPRLLSPDNMVPILERSKFLEFDASIYSPLHIYNSRISNHDPFAALSTCQYLKREDIPKIMKDITSFNLKQDKFENEQIMESLKVNSDIEYLVRHCSGLYSPRITSSEITMIVEDANFMRMEKSGRRRKPIRQQNASFLEFDETDTLSGRYISMPNIGKLISDSGKMQSLDQLLTELKAGGHRVLIYNQMTRMIDLMEEYLHYRGYSYIRLDGSSKIADRRDLVADWQSRPDIFVFLLSTRAGGLGINLTAADTVIFYDSDWNPTVDQQAMDRAHRLGQTKQVTVYRLITRNSIEERMRQRAKQKDEIHKVVIAGGEFRQMDAAKPSQRDIVSLLLDEQPDESHSQAKRTKLF